MSTCIENAAPTRPQEATARDLEKFRAGIKRAIADFMRERRRTPDGREKCSRLCTLDGSRPIAGGVRTARQLLAVEGALFSSEDRR